MGAVKRDFNADRHDRFQPLLFSWPLGSEVWHPICKQAARAEKKLKVSKPTYFLQWFGGTVL